MRELAMFFLRLGVTAFGGAAAHVAVMEDELVRRRRWLSREQFLDLLGASNLIPGPSSSELAIHIGYMRAGWPGLLVAGICFILPAALMVCGLAWAYVRFGNLAATSALLYGIKPLVIAVILQALWGLGKTAVKTPVLAGIGLASIAALILFGLHPLLLLLIAGTIAAALSEITGRQGRTQAASVTSLLLPPKASPMVASFATAGAAAVVAPFTLGSLFLVFLKVGAVVFGSGYVLLAFLRNDFVVHRGWLTDTQLTDAVAVGQITPGPVFTTATFIGYVLGGLRGAIAATIGIFLPAFLLVAASGPLVPRIRKSRIASAFLDGVNVASLALMTVVTWQLGRASLVDVETATLAAASLIVLLRFRVNSLWLVLGGAVIGLFTHEVHLHLVR
ncbi:MAG TPA: chromate efflux transporter [Candidatus Angelobacter sp.]|nr:chromate efflux transporter [Candidatus Angelobacter sp.]